MCSVSPPAGRVAPQPPRPGAPAAGALRPALVSLPPAAGPDGSGSAGTSAGLLGMQRPAQQVSAGAMSSPSGRGALAPAVLGHQALLGGWKTDEAFARASPADCGAAMTFGPSGQDLEPSLPAVQQGGGRRTWACRSATSCSRRLAAAAFWSWEGPALKSALPEPLGMPTPLAWLPLPPPAGRQWSAQDTVSASCERHLVAQGWASPGRPWLWRCLSRWACPRRWPGCPGRRLQGAGGQPRTRSAHHVRDTWWHRAGPAHASPASNWHCLRRLACPRRGSNRICRRLQVAAGENASPGHSQPSSGTAGGAGQGPA